MRRGQCPHRPEGTNEFAGDFRKNGLYRRVDVGIDPYAKSKRFQKFRNVSERKFAKSLQQSKNELRSKIGTQFVF